jgi:hypothetical protein
MLILVAHNTELLLHHRKLSLQTIDDSTDGHVSSWWCRGLLSILLLIAAAPLVLLVNPLVGSVRISYGDQDKSCMHVLHF